MKRNFLLTLLLTLLPLVSWAITFIDGVTVTINPAGPVQQTEQGYVPTVTVTYLPDGETEPQPLDENAYSLQWYIGESEVTPTADTPFKNAGTYTLRVTAVENLRFAGEDGPTMADGHKDFSFVISESGSSEPIQGDADVTEWEVKPKTSCVMYYGLPLVLKPSDILVTPNVSDDVKSAMLAKLKINQDLTAIDKLGYQEFDLGFIEEGEDKDKVTVGGVTYTISPTGKGVVDIRKGTNRLTKVDDEYVFEVAQGLVFNGGEQVLIADGDYTFATYSAAEGGNDYGYGSVKVVGSEKKGDVTYYGIKVLTNNPANQYVTNAAEFVGQTFYVTADPENLNEDARYRLYTKSVADNETTFTPEEIYASIQPAAKWSTYDDVEFFAVEKIVYDEIFAGENPPADEAAYLATVTWTELPKGIDAGEWYVWARAKDGGLLYDAADDMWKATATIAKADPVLAGTVEVDPTYYYFTGNGNFQNLKTKIEPSVAKLTVGVGDYSEPVDPANNIQYYIKKGTKSGDEITYEWPNGNKPTLASYEFEPGYYQIIATFKANKNFNTLLVNAAAAAGITDEFEVKKPTVTIQTLVKEGVSAIYAYGAEIPEKDLDWEVQKDKDNIIGWHGYEGTLPTPEVINATYTWKNSNGRTVNPENGLGVGTYTVTVSGNFNAGEDFGTPEILPATVIITASNILAAIEDQTLVFGQELPLKLKYSQGGYAPESEEIEDFEDIMWTEGFKAKMIKDANGDDVEDAEEIDLYAEQDHYTGNGNNRVYYYKTTILPVGTYEVTAPELVKNDVGRNQDYPEFTLLVAKGTWTVTPKDINNEDFGNRNYDTPDPRVKGMGRSFSQNRHETYTSQEITFGLRDLIGDFTYREGDFDLGEYGARPLDDDGTNEGQTSILPEDLVIPEDIQAIFAEIKETGKATDAQILEVLDFFMPILKKGLDPKGYYYGSLLLGKDFEITSYTNNINAGTATFHVKGIGNFKGERDLTFTIDKAKIYVFPENAFPETEEDRNVWAVGSPQKDAFQVDWNSKTEVEVEDGVKVPVGIKYQLHAFENDRQKDMTGEDGFKALKVKFTVGANVGEYEAGLKAYAENDEKADNYEFVFETAPLNIVQGTILLAVDDVEVTYSGKNKPQYTPGFKLAEGQNLDPALEQNWRTVVNDSKKDGLTFDDDLEADENGRYNADEYTITCTAFPAGTYESINYRFELAEGAEEGTLTVNPAEATIAVKACPKDDAPENTVVKNYKDFIDAAEEWNNNPLNAGNLRSAEDFKQEFIDQIGDVLYGNGMPLGFRNPDYFSVTGMQEGDTEFDLFGGAEVDDENNIIVSDNGNTNYDFTLTNGFLVIAPVNETLELTSEPVVYWTDKWGDYTDGNSTAEFPDGHDLPDGAEPVVKNGGDLAKIKTYDNVPVEAVSIMLKAATLDPENEAYSQWKAYEWHAMVLPFATTVGEIAYNFGYAVVNVVDVEATTASTKPNEVIFKLQEMEDEIPANTPFLIKSQYDFDYDTPLVFGNIVGSLAYAQDDLKPIVIEYNENPVVEAGRGITFNGTYDQIVFDKTTTNVKFLGPDSKWKRYNASSTSKYTMQPYTSYLDLGGFTGTREVVVILEEEDGSTTAINAAELQNLKSAEGLYRIDGVKVQGATTQKGVYIQDGKKFVK